MVKCLIDSGHFAGAVFDCKSGSVLANKSFHRYTTRRKQGGAQSSNDKSKGKAKSAGAGIRRYNEQALREEIKAQLVEWKQLLDESSMVFVKSPPTMKNVLFFDSNLLDSNDLRVRNLPFITKRPTLEELTRCFEEILCVKIVARKEVVVKENSKVFEMEKLQTHLVYEGENSAEQAPEAEILKIFDSIKRGRKDYLESLLNSSIKDLIVPDKYGTSFLHYASSQSKPELVEYLLEFGCDPTITNQRKQCPYDVASVKEVRDVFRRFRANYPQRYNYIAANIPEPLTKDMEEAQKHKEQERRKKERLRKKNMKPKAKIEEQQVQPVAVSPASKSSKKGSLITFTAMEKKTLGMTVEQKQRYEREKRAAAAEARIKMGKNACFNCGKSLAQVEAFEKANFKFCSMDCLKVC